MSFVNYCINKKDEDFEGSFRVIRNEISKNKEIVEILFLELQKTRMEHSSISINFETIAELNGVKSNNVKNMWAIIEQHLSNFPMNDQDYKKINEELTKKAYNAEQISLAMIALDILVKRTRKILASNFEGLEKSKSKRLGVLGELISYLYVTKIAQDDCIYSKIIPDNAGMPRHGMDLLSIKFGGNQEEDKLYLWEIKATINNFNDRCKEIVDWFNNNSESNITMMIESAKLNWKDKFSNEKFKRASAILAKFLFYKMNYVFSGSIIYDSDKTPTNNNLRKFNQINVKKQNKQLILFNTEDLKWISNEVYGKICKI